MTPGPSGGGRPGLVSGLRGLAKPARASASAGQRPDDEHCDLCGNTVPADHRHLLHLAERRIVCVCETCWARSSGDADFRPTGFRMVLLEEFNLSDELWAAFQIPIGLAFFFYSASVERVVGLYPSPAGATECELHLASWERLAELNPDLQRLEPDAEALIVDRMSEPHNYAIVPIDECYRLVGMIKASWEGISGGSAVEDSVASFFGAMRAGAQEK